MRLEADPTVATWSRGVLCAPRVPIRAFTNDPVARVARPCLVVAGEQDKQSAPQRVHKLGEDLASTNKTRVAQACSSDNAMWEVNGATLFDSNVHWVCEGQHGGTRRGSERERS